MDRNLIEKIVGEVVKTLLEPSSTVLVLAPASRDLRQRLAGFIDATDSVAFLEGEGLLPEGTSLGYKRVLLPFLSRFDMADLALGRACNATARLVMDLLFKGQQVEVMDWEYDGYKDTAPAELWSLVCGYEKILNGFGLVRARSGQSKDAVVRKRLITEKDIASLAGDGATTITISEKTIVTSLAADLAKSHELKIQRK